MSHKLLVKDQQGEHEVLLIDTVAVGRDPRCDISAADPLLSRRHAEFVVSGPTVVVRDLKSRNGILVNGRRMPQAVLHPGDVVQIAQLVVTFLSHIAPETMLAPIPSPEEGTGPAQAGDDKTSLLSASEIQAVAAASAEGRRERGNGGLPGAGEANGHASNGNGARKGGAWSVQLVAEDDRTKLVAPHMPPTLDVRADPPGQAQSPMEQASAATVDGTQASTLSGAAIDPLSALPLAPAAAGPLAGSLPSTTTRRRVPARIAARTLALAILCFTVGVASTMIWLQPPLSVRGILFDHVPLAVGVAFVFIIVVGGLAGLAIGKTVGRMESD